MARRILITGSSGRLGAPLTVDLARKHEVVQLSLEEPASPEQRELGPVFTGSITDPGVVESAMDEVDTVVHCAAVPGAFPPFDKLMETNVMGTYTVLEAAGRNESVTQFLFMSSLNWHGLHERHGGFQSPKYLPLDEEHPSSATGYYDTSKVLGESLCATYAKRFGKPAVALRPAWIVGGDFAKSFKATPPGMGQGLYDYVGLEDLIDGVRRLLDYDPPDGFDAFLFHAEDQRSTCPSVKLAERFQGNARIDEERLAQCEGFGALVNCDHATERLGWTPQFKCARD